MQTEINIKHELQRLNDTAANYRTYEYQLNSIAHFGGLAKSH
jgi:hypothetical protein